jgi:hypothetical protein
MPGEYCVAVPTAVQLLSASVGLEAATIVKFVAVLFVKMS